ELFLPTSLGLGDQDASPLEVKILPLELHERVSAQPGQEAEQMNLPVVLALEPLHLSPPLLHFGFGQRWQVVTLRVDRRHGRAGVSQGAQCWIALAGKVEQR